MRTTTASAAVIAAALALAGCMSYDPSEYTSAKEAGDIREYCVGLSHMTYDATHGTLTRQSAESFKLVLRSSAERLAQHRDDAKHLLADTDALFSGDPSGDISAWGPALNWCDAQGYR
ncbi:hypothetical protein ACWEO4_11310 [Streptomyces sp. NPDC004393]|uniref:hypothetical protein n=1 Tax=Streptomyces sp. NPDC004533 TaxID=3154278 RepID=UPI0033B8A01D